MDKPMIYSALSACMAEVGAIGKVKVNEQQKFKYRGIDDVMNALQPVLIKNKVFVVPEVLDERREERTTAKGGNLIYTVLKIKYTFYAEDGSNVSAIVIGEGMDSGDKSANKAQAIAMKYACFQVLCIPTEEMKDPDAETPDPSIPKEQMKKTEPAQKKDEQTEQTNKSESTLKYINTKQQWNIYNLLCEKWGKDKAPVKLIELTGYSGTKQIPASEYNRVIDILTAAAEVESTDDVPPWEE